MLNYYEIEIDEKGKDVFLNSVKNLSLEKLEKIKKDIFNDLSNDIEYFMEERLNNLKSQICDAVVAYILGKPHNYISPENKSFIEKFLNNIGYNSIQLRKKIFEDNKEQILKDITSDFIYESLEHSFNRYFGGWEYKDLLKCYPQTDIIKAFARYFIKNIDNSELIIKEELNKKILQLNDELKELKDKIEKAKNLLDEA